MERDIDLDSFQEVPCSIPEVDAGWGRMEEPWHDNVSSNSDCQASAPYASTMLVYVGIHIAEQSLKASRVFFTLFSLSLSLFYFEVMFLSVD